MQASPTPPVIRGLARQSPIATTALHLGTFVALLVLGACRDPQLSAYSVPKERVAPKDAIHGAAASGAAPTPAPADMSGGMAGQAVPTAAGMALSWTAPTHWEARQGSSMRKATYVVKTEDGATADLAVTAFPGDVGGEVANVNRWRGQVGLSTVSEADARAAIERIDANGLKIGVIDIADPSTPDGVRLLGAWVPHDGATWFFKLLGPDAVVRKEKAAFLEFVKTIKCAAHDHS